MRPQWIMLILFAAFFSGGVVSHCVQNRPRGFAAVPGIAWEYSVEETFKKAKASARPVFIDFYADWCGYCQKMDRESYMDPQVIGLSRRFVCARLNVDEHEDLARYLQVEGLPTLLFANPKTGTIKRVEGYVSARELAALMTQYSGER